MSAPTSPVEVCNLSLDLLRSPELVASIETPEGDVESLAARWYDAQRRSVLRMFPWNWARKRATIPRDATAPVFGYADAYILPIDYVNYVFVGEEVGDDIVDFVVEGKRLLINNDGATSLQLCYIYDVEDVTLFDPIFLMFLVGELAVVFANSLTGLNKAIPAMEKFRDRWEAKARAKNGQENPPKVRYSSPLLTARSRGRRSTGTDGTHLFT
jgi:hypothetical protein